MYWYWMPHSHSYFCVLSFEYAQETVLSFPVKRRALQGLWIERGPPNSKRQNCAGGIDFPGKTAGTLVPARPEASDTVGPRDVPVVLCDA